MIWLVQLVFDCADPDAIMQFWGRALDYRNPLIGVQASEVAAFRAANPQFDGRGRIDDDDLRRTPVYIQRVPEPKIERNRVRLEVATPEPEAATERVLELGATASRDGEFRDVEGNEFTIRSSDDGPTQLRSIVIDAIDPEHLLSFWSAATGYVADQSRLRCDPVPLGLTWAVDHFELGATPLRHITGTGGEPGPAPFDLTPGLQFSETDTRKHLKNRLHVDLNSTEAHLDRERLVLLGADVVRWDTDHVMVDPEGNEFCLSGQRLLDRN